MVYKFRIISDEVDDFLREIKIDSEASFYDLHEASAWSSPIFVFCFPELVKVIKS